MPTRTQAVSGGSRRRSRTIMGVALAALALIITALLPPGTSMAATAATLGAAESFAVLGSTTVTNTGPSVVNGDLGVYAGTAVTGFDNPGGPGIINGALHAGDATAQSAQADASTAYNALDAQGCDFTLADPELGGRTLTPGVYCVTTTAQLTGTLTLDALGDPAAVFIFRVPTALNTASGSSVAFLDDFATCNVFWQVGSAATIGTNTDFVGTVIAQTESIAVNTGAAVTGRLLSLGAAVTLDSNVITTPTCTLAVPTTSTTATTTPPSTTTPTPVGVTTDVAASVPPAATPGTPSLPATGSNLVPVAFAVLGIMVGSSILVMTHTARRTPARPSKR